MFFFVFFFNVNKVTFGPEPKDQGWLPVEATI